MMTVRQSCCPVLKLYSLTALIHSVSIVREMSELIVCKSLSLDFPFVSDVDLFELKLGILG